MDLTKVGKTNEVKVHIYIYRTWNGESNFGHSQYIEFEYLNM